MIWHQFLWEIHSSECCTCIKICLKRKHAESESQKSLFCSREKGRPLRRRCLWVLEIAKFPTCSFVRLRRWGECVFVAPGFHSLLAALFVLLVRSLESSWHEFNEARYSSVLYLVHSSYYWAWRSADSDGLNTNSKRRKPYMEGTTAQGWVFYMKLKKKLKVSQCLARRGEEME